MDQKLKDVIATVIGAVGAVAVYMGWTDSTTWAQFGGAAMVVIAVVLPYVWKPAA